MRPGLDTHGTNFSTDTFYEYHKDVQKKIKDKQIDLTLVVNMFLTGFDSAYLNTLYVDKNLRYHGLIQAYSRTNRLLNKNKPHGNIVSFRNLKEATDKALALYGDENAKEVVFKQSYEKQKTAFLEKLATLRAQVPTVADVDRLAGEQEQATFVKSFRDLLRLKATLETYAEFSFADVGISEQEFYDYQSKYLDMHESRTTATEKSSILDLIDFELELTARDLIDFDYIIQLIAGLKGIKSDSAREKKTSEILKIFDRDAQLRKKKDLVKKFIEESLPTVTDEDKVETAFEEFWSSERGSALQCLAQDEKLSLEDLEKFIREYGYNKRLPTVEDILERLPERPRLAEQKTVGERVRQAIKDIADIFAW